MVVRMGAQVFVFGLMRYNFFLYFKTSKNDL